MPLPNDNPMTPSAGRFIGGIFGFAFAGVGLTLLIYLWAFPFDQFDSPPLFFRFMGSFIAVVFVAAGGGVLVSSIRGRTATDTGTAKVSSMRAELQSMATVTFPASYSCPHCGAPLPERAEVSPMGDAKCPFCHTWFNVHQKTA